MGSKNIYWLDRRVIGIKRVQSVYAQEVTVYYGRVHATTSTVYIVSIFDM